MTVVLRAARDRRRPASPGYTRPGVVAPAERDVVTVSQSIAFKDMVLKEQLPA